MFLFLLTLLSCGMRQAGRPLEPGWKSNREAALRQALQNKVVPRQPWE